MTNGEKKTKLTISGSAKKSIKNIELAKTQGKNSVLIEKSKNKPPKKNSFFKHSSSKSKPIISSNRGNSLKPSFGTKVPSAINDFERRKLAEQRATKRLKGDNEGKK